ncbi:protein KINESIN LIGHT CHAIN-RELATED 1-like isoform X1 [Olea europaea var. sylvestris]|uniref:protein KINESIN LIGHT CHAIN-RELATED 1-like isoform X1 n=1 Tax=Olea europaea var. sylvestris TaxID=158386 RepID=UPI000C1D1A33|nr:protein KINESIN LIGHT CHAIN-RELATED 1-like isoform X1 [Olea europaea var. sylvestris]
MRRASSRLLSHLLQPPTKASYYIVLRDSTSYFSPLAAATTTTVTTNDQSLSHKSLTHLNSCSKTPSFLFFSPKTSQNLNTLVDPNGQNVSKMSSRQRKIKERSQIEEAFESAESADDMLEAFKDMEASFDERELGLACLKMGLKLDQEGEDPEKALSFAQRALKIMDDDQNNSNKSSLPLAMTLQLLGSASYSLNKFNDSLGYLNRANRVLTKIEQEGSCSANDIRPVLHAVQFELYNTKTAMGRREEAIGNLRKSLEIKEMTLEEDSGELGKANRDVAEAYVAVLNFKEALPFCLKAMEINKMQLGHNSVEVAHDRRLLGVIYTGLEEHEKALEQNQLSQRVLKNWGCSSDLLRAEIDAANMQIALGRYDEAINTLKGVVQQTDKESEDQALVFISMAKALCNQEKFADSKRCLEIACGILDKKESSSPLNVAEAFMEISMQYETMNEFETAISLLKRTMAMLEKLPQEQHSVGSVSARIGWLLLLTGKVEEAIPYLEDAAERLKESFGSKHFGVGYVYNNLGAAYLELDRPQSAAQMFAYAKDIMDVSLGPHHADSIEACQNLSKAYAVMGSYPLAINFQEKVVESWEGHGPSAQYELKEAIRVLEQLKSKACGSSSDSLMKALPLSRDSEGLSGRNLKSRVSVKDRCRNDQLEA